MTETELQNIEHEAQNGHMVVETVTHSAFPEEERNRYMSFYRCRTRKYGEFYVHLHFANNGNGRYTGGNARWNERSDGRDLSDRSPILDVIWRVAPPRH